MSRFWRRVRRWIEGEQESPETKEIAGPSAADSEEAWTGRPTDGQGGPRIIVGLDFGTSGSKVVLRHALKMHETPVALDFGTPSELGFSRFVFPSTVAIHDGALHFGVEAERIAGETTLVFRSLKRSLIRMDASDAQSRPSDDGRLVDLERARDMSKGGFAQVLATLYLADVLRRTREAIPAAFGENTHDEQILIYLDVPVSSLSESSQEADVFRTMLRVARRLSRELPEGLTVTHAGVLYERAMESVPGNQGESEALEAVVAEAVAAIAGLGHAIGTVRGHRNFAVIDIGAGTTDMGVFRFPTEDGKRAVFYSAATTPLGCDDLDRVLCELLGQRNPTIEELAVVRHAKARAGRSSESSNLSDLPISQEMVDQAVERVADDCREAWRRTFASAYQKEKDESRWHSLDLYLLGGGSLILGWRRLYAERPRHSRVREVRLRGISQDLSLRAGGASETPPSVDDHIFLLTALGLAAPGPERPRMVHPDNVKPVVLDWGPSGHFDFDADDLYAK